MSSHRERGFRHLSDDVKAIRELLEERLPDPPAPQPESPEPPAEPDCGTCGGRSRVPRNLPGGVVDEEGQPCPDCTSSSEVPGPTPSSPTAEERARELVARMNTALQGKADWRDAITHEIRSAESARDAVAAEQIREAEERSEKAERYADEVTRQHDKLSGLLDAANARAREASQRVEEVRREERERALRALKDELHHLAPEVALGPGGQALGRVIGSLKDAWSRADAERKRAS